MVAIPGWFVAFFGVTVIPEAIWGVIFLTVWFGLPLAIYLDAKKVRIHTDRPSRTWVYVLTSLIWLLAIVPAGLYLWRRRTIDDSTAETPRKSTQTDTDSPQSTVSSPPSNGTGTKTVPLGPTEQASRNDTSPAQETTDVSTNNRATDWMDIEYDGERYHAQTVTSPNSTYTVAYQDGQSGAGAGETQPGRVFLFQDGELRFTTKISRPNACAVANDGTVAVVDWNLDWGDELSGTFYVFDRAGHQLVEHECDANLGPVAITPDGAYAATSTYNPDCSTYLFDTEAGTLLLEHENQHGNVQTLSFVDQADGWMLRLGDPGGDTAYGIDFAGHTVWKSQELKQQERLDRLLESSDEAELREALDLLKEARDLATEDYEHRNAVQRLAETHWKLAQSIKQEDGVTDDWWDHLDQASKYYDQTLPRYAGKQGLAKVKRQQGKQHLKEGNKPAARDCFEEIARLEEEYGVQLLTDADERRLDELESSY